MTAPVFLRDQKSCNVLGIGYAQPEARHHRHVLYLEFVAVVGTLTVLQIEHVGQTFFGVILGTNIFLL